MDEYIYKNSVREKPCAIRLSEFSMEWQCGEKKKIIPYANIIALTLNKLGNKFTMHIESDYQGTLAITNRFYLGNGDFEDRSRQYNTFVRLIHFHLSRQETTLFFAGSSLKKIVTLVALSLLCCIGFQSISIFLLGYFDMVLLAISVFVFLMVCALSLRRLPKPYDGDDIPLQYLPAISS